MTPPVTSITVTYRSRHTVGAMLDAAKRCHDAGLLDAIIVENASGDDVASFVAREHPWVRFIDSGANLGFGRGCNLGARHVTTPYLVLLNPDAVLEPEALRTMVRFMDEHPKAAVCAPAIPEDDSFQEAGGLPTPGQVIRGALGASFGGYRGRRHIIPGEAPFRTDWVCGAVMMFRTSVFRELGGFDPRYFLYFEETDFCRRAAERGHEIWAVGTAKADHANAASAVATGKRLYEGCLSEFYFPSRFYYLVKHHGWLPAALAEVGEVAILAVAELPRRVLRRGGGALAARLTGPVLRLPATPDRDDGGAPAPAPSAAGGAG